jgi:DNA-binding transcriptional LysR family regulator
MPSADLNQMVVFAAVVREGSFTAAARALGQPKSTVSKRVAELERRLGARMLHRSTRRVQTTVEGAAYFASCERVVRDAEAADRAMMDRESTPRGLVRLSAPVAMGAFVAPILEAYLHAHPGVALDVVLVDRRVDLIKEGFDLALRAGPLRDSALVVRRLAQTERCLCASPRLFADRAAPRHPRELARHECIAFRTEPGKATWTFERGHRATTVAVTGRYSVSSGALARSGALAGLGIANLPRFLVADDLLAGRLVPVLPGWPLKRGEIHLLYASGVHLSPRVRALIDLFVDRFARPKA